MEPELIDIDRITTPIELRERVGWDVITLVIKTEDAGCKLSEDTIRRVERGGRPTVRTVNAYTEVFKKWATRSDIERILRVVAPDRPRPNAGELNGRLDYDDVAAMLMRGERYGKAAYCAYLAGDFSVLLTKLAIAYPAHAFIHACVEEAPVTDVRVYYRCGENLWERHEETSRTVTRRLRQGLLAAHEHFACAKSFRIAIVSELQRGAALYEEGALVVAIAAAVSTHPSAHEPDDFQTLKLAATFLREWYTDASWGTLSASSHDPAGLDNDVLVFDRNGDGVELFEIYKHQLGLPSASDVDLEVELKANFYPEEKFWKTKKRFFDVSQLEIWWNGIETTVDERTVREWLGRFEALPFKNLLSQMIKTLERKSGDEDWERKLALLMQSHQLMLASVNLVGTDAQKLIAKVNGLSEYVLGAKLASGRIRGAFVVLVERGISHTKFEAEMKKLGLKPLSEYRSEIQLVPGEDSRAARP